MPAVLGGSLLIGAVLLVATVSDPEPDPSGEADAPPGAVGAAQTPQAGAPTTKLAGPAGSCDATVQPGESIQAALDQGPPGRTICLSSGTHRVREPLDLRSGARLVGKPGARLNGAKIIRRWNRKGRAWVARRQRTGPTIQCMSGVSCSEVLHKESILADDVFVDGIPLRRVLSKKQLGRPTTRPTRGRYFFNYKVNKIWINLRPTRRRVEVAVAEGLIEGGNDVQDVTVEGLVLEKAAGFGVSSENGTGWTIRNNEVRLNHTKGIRVWAGARILGNHVHHNGQYGVAASDGPGIVVEGNRIHHNNLADYRIADGFWDAGGTKFVRTSDLVFRGNEVYSNNGDGVWIDIDSTGATIQGNTIDENARFGVFYEISKQGTIVGNTLRGNGEDAIQITSSADVEAAANTIVVSPQDPEGGGITLVQDDRETEGYVLQDASVHDNTLTMCRGTSGASKSFGADAIFNERNNVFDRNTYRVPDVGTRAWQWLNGVRTWAEWRSFGQDPSGALQETAC